MNNKLQILNKTFENKKVRTVWNSDEEKYYISVVDIVSILTESKDATAYWRKLKQRLKEEGNETVTNCHALKMLAKDGKNRLTDVVDLKVTGGTYNITATSKGLQANDSIRIADGTLAIKAGTDGLHAEYDEDDSVGYVYILGGNISINAGDDGIHATTIAQFEGGTINITAGEGIEGTYILINNGTINIKATDDGINAANKSSKYSIKVEINGGTITVDMGQGDTDAIDSNGDLLITGGTITINAQSPFDYDGTGSKTGGKIIVNGSETDTLSNQMMGGGMRENNGRRR